MNDKDIIKALECCHGQLEADCKNCPNKNTCGEIDVIQQTLDLINRQQEKISELQHKILSCNAEIEKLKEELDGETVENMRLRHEIERLKEGMKFERERVDNIPNLIKQAIKEFAERLKEKGNMTKDGVVVVDYQIDNLVKEMGGK